MCRAARLAVLFLVCFPVWGAALANAGPVEKRVYKVDSVIASVKGRVLTIQAKGAVESGGWNKPRLRVMRASPSEPRAVVVEFLAVPPSPGRMVIQALVPIQAVVHIPARPRIGSVRAVAEANEVTSQVLH
jgi:hypothetical protein